MIDYSPLSVPVKEFRYVLNADFAWEFAPFGWRVELKEGMLSDGATFARDLGAREIGWRKYWSLVVGYLMDTPRDKKTCAWYVHDQVCNTGKLADGRDVPNITASIIIGIALWRDGFRREAIPWTIATFFGGGGKAKENGWLWLKRK